MSNDLHDFEQFMQQREEEARAYVNGDAEPLCRLTASNDPATFFSPRGDVVQGASTVTARYEADAAGFATNNENTIQIVAMGASDGMAYWVGMQHSAVHLQGKAGVVPFHLRVTEIFRREGDAWKLVHRHADTLATASEE